MLMIESGKASPQLPHLRPFLYSPGTVRAFPVIAGGFADPATHQTATCCCNLRTRAPRPRLGRFFQTLVVFQSVPKLDGRFFSVHSTPDPRGGNNRRCSMVFNTKRDHMRQALRQDARTETAPRYGRWGRSSASRLVFSRRPCAALPRQNSGPDLRQHSEDRNCAITLSRALHCVCHSMACGSVPNTEEKATGRLSSTALAAQCVCLMCTIRGEPRNEPQGAHRPANQHRLCMSGCAPADTSHTSRAVLAPAMPSLRPIRVCLKTYRLIRSRIG